MVVNSKLVMYGRGIEYVLVCFSSLILDDIKFIEDLKCISVIL